MNLQEMLTTENPESITDQELKNVAYGLINGEFALELQPRQLELQARLAEIERAEKLAQAQRVSIPAPWAAYRDDSSDDEYEWS